MSSDAREFHGPNAFLVVLGIVLVVAAIRGFEWYKADVGSSNVAPFTFTDLRANADTLNAVVARAFFDWLAWTLLVGAGVAALVAVFPSPVCDSARVCAFLLGLLGAIATYYAVAQLHYAQRAAGGSSESITHNSSYGLWACLGGFVLIMAAGGRGARQVGDDR